jgi:fibronectin type 3 domain-containing protein
LATNGSHTITASTTDTNANVATASISVTVGNTTSTPPQSLVTASGNNQVGLSWSAPASSGGSAISQYLIYDRFTGSSTFALYATTTASQTTSTVTSLTNGQSYDFEIIAQNTFGTSTPSNIAFSTPGNTDTIPPTAPSALISTAIYVNQVNLSWASSTDNIGVTGYAILRNGTQIMTVSSSSLGYNDNTVSGGTAYTYTVQAFDAAGNFSSSSNSVFVTTLGLSGGGGGGAAAETIIQLLCPQEARLRQPVQQREEELPATNSSRS